MSISICARLGHKTTYLETLRYPQQDTVFVWGTKMCVSGLVPLSNNTPGEGYQSMTVELSKCTQSQARVFIQGDAMAHHHTFLDSDPAHYINRPYMPGEVYVAYPS